jgi:hypothetical protein
MSTFQATGLEQLRSLLGKLDPTQLQTVREDWQIQRGESHLAMNGIAEDEATAEELARAYSAADREFRAILGMSNPVNPSSPQEPGPELTRGVMVPSPDANLDRHKRILKRLADAGVTAPVDQAAYNMAREQVLADEGRRP